MDSKVPTISEVFNQQLILALQSGMTYKEFWEEDPEMFWAYHFYFYKKQEADIESMNFNAWLNGLYVYNAVSTSLSNVFKSKGSKASDYIGQPIDLKTSSKEQQKEKIKSELSSTDLTIKERALQIKRMLDKKKAIK